MKKLHAVVATEAQKYVASMFEVHSEVQQLRDNLREQHRVWTDFYSTVNGVCHPVYTWAARYNTWLFIKLTLKGVVFSFLFLLCPTQKFHFSGHCITPYCKAHSSCQSYYHVSDLLGCAPVPCYCSSHSKINKYMAGRWPSLLTFLSMIHK